MTIASLIRWCRRHFKLARECTLASAVLLSVNGSLYRTTVLVTDHDGWSQRICRLPDVANSVESSSGILRLLLEERWNLGQVDSARTRLAAALWAYQGGLYEGSGTKTGNGGGGSVETGGAVEVSGPRTWRAKTDVYLEGYREGNVE